VRLADYLVTKRAHQAVANAIRAGRMEHAHTCEVCGVTTPELRARRPDLVREQLVVWHHPDPLRRLDVIPLCVECHAAVHAGNIPEPRTGRVYVSPQTLAAERRRGAAVHVYGPLTLVCPAP
jgi:hypothetical protein